MVLRTVAGAMVHKILVAVNEKGRTPDPGLEFHPTFLTERLIEEAQKELLPEVIALTSKRSYDLTDEDFNRVMDEIADVRAFSHYVEEAITVYYRQVRVDQLFHTWNETLEPTVAQKKGGL